MPVALVKKKYYLLLCLLAYSVIYFFFLKYADFLPYVVDNNETYSSLVHAYNMYFGDWSKSFGLTDEAFSPDPDAHPYVHTRQGNWPRIYAFILFALGARSAESQIIIHVFTIGLASIWFMYKYFEKVSTPKLALIISLVFMTDYMLFMQWQIVTYRVWHVFFVFSSLLCMHGLADEKGNKWKYLTFINFLCLCYWELIFALFVTLWSFLYYCLISKFAFKKAIRTGVIVAAGCITSLTILFSQLVLYMGVKNTLKDFYYAFFSRNSGAGGVGISREVLEEFYNGNNIAFFYNIVDTSKLRSIYSMLQSIGKYVLQIHTPAMSIIAILGLISLVLLQTNKIKCIKGLDGNYISKSQAIVCTAIFLSLVFLVIAANNSFLGPDSTSHFFAANEVCLQLCLLAFSVPLSMLMYRFSFPFSNQINILPFITVNIFFLLSAFLLFMHHAWYESYTVFLWYQEITSQIPVLFWMVMMASVIVSCGIVILNQHNTTRNYRVLGLNKYLLSGAVSFTIVYLISPGYVISGYLVRHAPFAVYIADVLITIGLLSVIANILHASSLSFAINAVKNNGGFWLRVLNVVQFKIIGYLCACMIVLYWSIIQFSYFRLLPPDSFLFIKQFRQPKFQNKSIVTNTYSLPFAYETNSWAFMNNHFYDPIIDEDIIQYGYTMNNEYLWYRDRDEKIKYLYPDYYVCFVPKSYAHVVEELHNGASHPRWCGMMPPTNRLQKENDRYRGAYYRHRIVDADTPIRDAWSIVKLDWSTPPVLKRIHGRYFQAKFSQSRDSVTFDFNIMPQYDNLVDKFEINIFDVTGYNKIPLKSLVVSFGHAEAKLDFSRTQKLRIEARPISGQSQGRVFVEEFLL